MHFKPNLLVLSHAILRFMQVLKPVLMSLGCLFLIWRWWWWRRRQCKGWNWNWWWLSETVFHTSSWTDNTNTCPSYASLFISLSYRKVLLFLKWRLEGCHIISHYLFIIRSWRHLSLPFLFDPSDWSPVLSWTFRPQPHLSLYQD